MITWNENNLLTVLELYGGLLEDQNQRIAALVNCLSQTNCKKYEQELKRVKAHGPSTDILLALEPLREK